MARFVLVLFVSFTSSADTIVSRVSLEITGCSVLNRTSFRPFFVLFNLSQSPASIGDPNESFSTEHIGVFCCSSSSNLDVVDVVVVAIVSLVISVCVTLLAAWRPGCSSPAETRTGCIYSKFSRCINRKKSIKKLTCRSIILRAVRSAKNRMLLNDWLVSSFPKRHLMINGVYSCFRVS